MSDVETIDFKDLRTGQWVRIIHQYPNGKIEYVGKVSEVSAKWLKLNYGAKNELIVPQTSRAVETIFPLSDEEKKAFAKKGKK